ncbi:MAG: Asp-tRNA(Asn)/Glu-tRNA(Gln) amidotransferase subunit GatC [Desulfobacterales bacterium]|nr:Asp-tRNA(Asn)/Glu-tRNA(Gln) amidotransferase subunit GatC [Desulfobacterales bacterium]
MKITKEEVLYVANLARLEIGAEEIEKLTGQIGGILDYVDQLNQVGTAGVAGTSHAVPLTNAFREDTLETHLANAPQPEEGGFGVPKII